MNIHPRDIDRDPTREEAEEALHMLRVWAGGASKDEIATLDPVISRLLPGAPETYPPFARP